jgi:hypothetical protein
MKKGVKAMLRVQQLNKKTNIHLSKEGKKCQSKRLSEQKKATRR